MRHVIWAKDDTFKLINEPEYHMSPAAIEVPKHHDIPITWDFSFRSPPIGRFTDIRIEDGDLTGEAVWFESTELRDPDVLNRTLEFYRFGGYFNEVVRENFMNAKNEITRVIITHATLRSVAFAPKNPDIAANPGARVNAND